jgi:hypothetical protein
MIDAADAGRAPAGNPEVDRLKKAVSKEDIIFYFTIEKDEKKNRQWWGTRMRDAKRYGLSECRASIGRGGQPSMWIPDEVAGWLIDKGYMDQAKACQVVEEHFAACADSIDYLRSKI